METKSILKRTVIIGAIVILIDQIVKFIMIKYCSENSFEVIKGFLSFNTTKNIGVAFSLNSGNFKNIVITSCVLILIIRYLFTQSKFLNIYTLTSLDFVVAGGIGNLIDRIFRGGVVDYIQISSFPIFNIADMAVVCGWIVFAFYIIKFEVKNT